MQNRIFSLHSFSCEEHSNQNGLESISPVSTRNLIYGIVMSRQGLPNQFTVFMCTQPTRRIIFANEEKRESSPLS